MLLVTLRRSEAEFSPTTRYNDYLVSTAIVHWESQSTTRAGSATGQRYVDHARDGSSVLIFMRENRDEAHCCLGPARYVSHEGERPMRVLWKLDLPVPAALYQPLKAAAG